MKVHVFAASFAALAVIGCEVLASAQESKPASPVRIFVVDVSSHDVSVARASGASSGKATVSESGGEAHTWGAYSAYASGGNYPQMPEVAKEFVRACPQLAVVTTEQDKADYLFIVNHERFKTLEKHNKTVFVNRAGDVVWGNSTRKLDNAVKDACAWLKGPPPAKKK